MWVLAAARPFGWLCCVVVICLLATYIAAVTVMLLTKDSDRRKAAKSVLDRHPLTHFRYRKKTR
jgi:hypothetical protein